MKKRVLVAVDGTPRGTRAIEFVRGEFNPDEVYVIVLTVYEDVAPGGLREEKDYEQARKALDPILDAAKEGLAGFEIQLLGAIGRAAEHILDTAEEENADVIVMTKSHRTIGSVTSHVVKYATCMIMIVPE